MTLVTTMNEEKWLSLTDPKEIISWIVQSCQKDIPPLGTLSTRKMRWLSAHIWWLAFGSENCDIQKDNLHWAENSGEVHHSSTWGYLDRIGRDYLVPHATYLLNLTRMFHDVIGNPFKPIIQQEGKSPLWDMEQHGMWTPPYGMIRNEWLNWNNSTVTYLAKEIEEKRNLEGTLDQELLPILADALEESGCDIPEMVSHLRKDQLHWRGCWVLDLLLGKE